ncbi:MAG TPA: shikimate kinase [Microbacterium sp.]|nr:shikimate kinase [Microbacterium sp.]
MSVVLVGPMGAGKTSIGRKVAKMLGVTFTDTDKVIASEYGPIPDLFAQHGEAYFRELECAVTARALSEGGVISLGGGAVTSALTRELLRQHPVVFLTVSPDAIPDRIRHGNRPLLAGGDDPVITWNQIFEQRRDWYEEVATLTVDTSHRPMHRIAEEVAAWRRELT